MKANVVSKTSLTEHEHCTCLSPWL